IGIGRFGCLLNGCCWGQETKLPWPLSIQFPFGSIPYMQHLEQDRVSPGFRLWPRDDLDRWQRAGSQPFVDTVEPGSWAADAGLKSGDLIVRLNDRTVARRETERGPEGGSPLLALLARLKPGNHVALEVSRSGQAITLEGTFNPEPPRSLPVHPTQIYLALGGWLLLALTMAYYPFRRRHGEVMAILMVGYAISRFLTELLRGDEPLAASVKPLSHLVGIEGLTMSQLISLVLFVGGILMWVWLRRQPASQST
ncbi:MAG: prolipoprotein diacylglyceryl transferase, partial [Planctomycetes bacterium]|nr:prolipoprotein diacylglyceryl transferase [Planctomycetota bacterium]